MAEWQGCYDESWVGILVNEAMSHPAKYSRGLIRRIYQHCLERGYLKAGDLVADPFGGTGAGALDALANGINYIAVELEPRFVDMAAGCDCTGISKADWTRFYGRWSQINHKDGRHWCPQCIAEASQIITSTPQMSLFDLADSSAAYVRNSGRIPATRPHRYNGNLSRFERYARGGAGAVLVQGDSRELSQIVGQVCGVISSPPYAEMANGERRDPKKTMATEQRYRDNHPELANRRPKPIEPYGAAPGQLSNLPVGDLSAVITSPPFAGNSGGRGDASRNGIDAALFERHSGGMIGGTGDNPANLAHLPMRGIEAVISSPPYIDSIKTGRDGIDWTKVGDNSGRTNGRGAIADGYGHTNGQLGAMPEGEAVGLVEGILSSPPYSPGQSTGGEVPKFPNGLQRSSNGIGHNYGTTPGQLGIEQGQTFWAAAHQIVSECYKVLKPGGVAVWVCKDFIRNSRRVPFSDQWIALCEAVGFRLVERHKAMLVKDKGRQVNLNGDTISLQVARKSFFRRLFEKSRPDLAIDYEDVLILVKD